MRARPHDLLHARFEFLGQRSAPSRTILFFDPKPTIGFVHSASGLMVRLRAKMFSRTLDAQLATGQSPESSRQLATRAQYLVALETRGALASDWEHLLDVVRRQPTPVTAQVPICRDRVLVAEPRLRIMIDCLRASLPIAARGVALANLLLSDMASPVYNRRSTLDLSDLASSIATSLDPATSLFVSDSALRHAEEER